MTRGAARWGGCLPAAPCRTVVDCPQDTSKPVPVIAGCRTHGCICGHRLTCRRRAPSSATSSCRAARMSATSACRVGSWWSTSDHVWQGRAVLWELLAALQACGCTCSCAACCTGPCTWEHAAKSCHTVVTQQPHPSCSTHIAAGQVGLVPAQELLLHLQLGTALCLQPTRV